VLSRRDDACTAAVADRVGDGDGEAHPCVGLCTSVFSRHDFEKHQGRFGGSKAARQETGRRSWSYAEPIGT
jgi:hypothetical protein